MAEGENLATKFSVGQKRVETSGALPDSQKSVVMPIAAGCLEPKDRRQADYIPLDGWYARHDPTAYSAGLIPKVVTHKRP